MPPEIKEIILVVEDVEAWRGHIRAVLTELFPDLEVREAENAEGAIEVIEGCEQAGERIRLILSDLHMSKTEDNNGDVLLAHQMEIGMETPPFAFVSGTLVDRFKTALRERIPGIVFLEKDAFLPQQAGTSERRALETSLQRLMRADTSQLPNDPAYLEVLRGMKGELSKVPELRVFIDRIKGRIGDVWGRYAEFLSGLGEPAEFLREPDLYGEEDNPHKLHTFKNHLSLFIGFLQQRADVPAGLVDELMELQVYINQVYRTASANGYSNLAADVGGVVKNFGIFGVDRLRFWSMATEVEGSCVNIPSAASLEMLVGMIQNAILHSVPGTPIRVDVENDFEGRVIVSNQIEGVLPVTVKNNEMVYAGEGSQERAGGFVRGLSLICEAAKREVVIFNLSQRGGNVTASLNYGAKVKRDSPTSSEIKFPAREVAIEGLLPDVVRICHDGDPGKTFKGMEGLVPRGGKYVDVPFKKDLRGFQAVLEARRENFENAGLCVVHVNLGEISDGFLKAIAFRYPHLVILPASRDGDIFRRALINDYAADRVEYPNDIFQNILFPDEIEPNLRSGDPSIEEIKQALYEKEYEPRIWAVLLRITNEIAVQRKRAHEA